MKGPVATQETEAGNDWDQASLLIYDLSNNYSGDFSSIQYDYGVVGMPLSEVMDWLGLQETGNAGNDASGLLILFKQAGVGAQFNPVGPASYTTPFYFPHVWVVATIKNGPTYSMDPSIKFREYQPGMGDIFQAYPWGTLFQTTASSSISAYSMSTNTLENQYLTSPQNAQTPLEFYEQQLTVSLGLSITNSGKSIADIPYSGPIIANGNSTLPSTLFTVFGSTSTSSTITSAFAQTVTITLTNGSPQVKLKATLPMYEVSTDAISVDYTGTSGNYTPSLFVINSSGTAQNFPFTGTNAAMTSQDTITLSIMQTNPQVQVETFYRPAGDPIGIGLGVQQFSDSLMGSYESLLASDYQAYLTSPSATAMELYQRTLDAVAEMRYLQQYEQQTQQIASLGGDILTFDNADIGIMTGSPSPVYDQNTNLAHPIFSQNTYTDNPGLNAYLAPVQIGTYSNSSTNTSGTASQVMELISDNESALESWVIQDMFDMGSISTVTGFQYIYQFDQTPAHAVPQGPTPPTLLHIPKNTSLASLSARLTNLNSEELTEVDYVVNNESIWIYNERITLAYAGVNNQSINWQGIVFMEQPGGSMPSLGCAIWQDGMPDTLAGAVPDSAPQVNAGSADSTSGALIGDPVNPYNGSVTYNAQDIDLPNPGLSLDFSRYYNSYNGGAGTAFSGNLMNVGMGPGWTYSFSEHLNLMFASNGEYEPTSILWITDDGTQHTFSSPAATTPPQSIILLRPN